MTRDPDVHLSIAVDDETEWEFYVVEALLDGDDITVFDVFTGARRTLRARDFAGMKDIWAAARRRLIASGLPARTFEQIVLARRERLVA